MSPLWPSSSFEPRGSRLKTTFCNYFAVMLIKKYPNKSRHAGIFCWFVLGRGGTVSSLGPWSSLYPQFLPISVKCGFAVSNNRLEDCSYWVKANKNRLGLINSATLKCCSFCRKIIVIYNIIYIWFLKTRFVTSKCNACWQQVPCCPEAIPLVGFSRLWWKRGSPTAQW